MTGMGLLANAQTYIQTNPWLAFVAVFVGGALTASSPCVLAMIPLVIGFVGGYDGISGWKRSFGFSLVFVFGLAVSFTAMGVIAVSLGRLFGDVGEFWPWVIAAVCLAMAAHLWDLWTFSVPEGLARYRPRHAGVIGAFTLGLLFGLVSAPCAAPILVVVLTYIASQGNLPYGLALLWTYAVGHCLLIVAAGTSMGVAKQLIRSRGLGRANRVLKRVAGALIAGVGVAILVSS
ncbi:cytochrome c biogenesis CcdA family protein [Deferrisoma camini]|uniref:cytochrome c biogenesis CcdA family protein n=1 Tax=Deferrisoma camini TaxID=1035120 RepID=UPI0004B60599|nr:cytochrome c biogenesis protein CcdA [Deferrisoma camini]